MKDINEEISSIISSLGESTQEINSNVQKLADTVIDLKQTILDETKNSYEEIKDSLENLKRQVRETESVIDNLEKDEYRDRTQLNIGYFTILVNMKNEIMNYNINNLDSIIEGLDRFDNTRSSFYERLSKVFDETFEGEKINEKDTIEFIYNSLNKEIEIYTKYGILIRDTLNNVKENILKLSNFFIASYDLYISKINENYKDYSTNSSLLLKGISSIGDLFNSSNIDKQLLNDLSVRDKMIEDKYQEESEKLFNEFKELSSKQVSHLENILSKELSIDGLFINKEETMSKIKQDLIDSSSKDEIIDKLEKALDTNSLSEVITLAYKKLNNETYEAYKEKESKLEKEYELEKAKTRNNHQKTKLVNSVSLEDSIVQNSLFNEETRKKANELFNNSLMERIDITYDYLKGQARIIESIRNILSEFNYSIDLINLSLSKDIETENITLEREIKLIKEVVDYATTSHNYFYSNLYKEELKNIALLDYEIKLSRLHRNYITAKGIMVISSKLFEKSRELDLLKPRYELKKIIDEYDISRLALEKALDAEIKILNKTKARQEATSLTNYQYAMSYLEHRLLTASELIDMAIKEYNLRIDVLKDIKDTYSSFDTYRIDSIIGKYLDRIKEMNEIKELDLNSLLQKIEYFSKDTDEDKLKNIERCNEILSGYKEMNNKIQKLMTSDPEIEYHSENIESFNEVVIDSFDTTKDIRESSLKEAFKSLYAVEDEFNSMITNLDSIKTIDYTTAFNEYKLSYLIEINRLNKKLDEMSDPKVEELNTIARHYQDNIYKKEFQKLNDEHERLTNEYYRELLDRYSQIDLEEDLFPSIGLMKDADFQYLIDNTKLSYLNREKEIIEIYNKNVQSLETSFKEKINESNATCMNDIESINNALLEHKNNFELEIKEYEKKEKLSFKKLEKINKSLKKRYSFEYYAFETDLKNKIKTVAGAFIYAQTRRHPMIIPLIMSKGE